MKVKKLLKNVPFNEKVRIIAEDDIRAVISDYSFFAEEKSSNNIHNGIKEGRLNDYRDNFKE